jgi:hypothetical protein
LHAAYFGRINGSWNLVFEDGLSALLVVQDDGATEVILSSKTLSGRLQPTRGTEAASGWQFRFVDLNTRRLVDHAASSEQYLFQEADGKLKVNRLVGNTWIEGVGQRAVPPVYSKPEENDVVPKALLIGGIVAAIAIIALICSLVVFRRRKFGNGAQISEEGLEASKTGDAEDLEMSKVRDGDVKTPTLLTAKSDSSVLGKSQSGGKIDFTGSLHDEPCLGQRSFHYFDSDHDAGDVTFLVQEPMEQPDELDRDEMLMKGENAEQLEAGMMSSGVTNLSEVNMQIEEDETLAKPLAEAGPRMNMSTVINAWGNSCLTEKTVQIQEDEPLAKPPADAGQKLFMSTITKTVGNCCVTEKTDDSTCNIITAEGFETNKAGILKLEEGPPTAQFQVTDGTSTVEV